ncbi:fructose-specific PTS transporter subunit EIIC [Rothia sp. ZJ932]|uniref:PTS fructose transporter subunit IIABC n=1 Tax=Rothia sp. ZJ932 TaxID=2810516 RepID=UPI0019681E7C|nr:fructose-specific PTS transporter subunit EIIC [Rothia sp. ZJ932]QRZ61895.1 PTS sugar transporter subunit IIA [Rothia sp. ZJ932]
MSALITTELVTLDENLGATRFDVIEHLVKSVVNAGRASSFDTLYADAKARESKTDTGIPGGIAIPHCRSEAVTEPTLAMARPRPGVDFGAKDGAADLIFFIAAPADGDQAHLKILSKMARSLMKKSFTSALREAKTEQEIVDLVNDALDVNPDGTDRTAEQKAAATQIAAPATTGVASVATGSAANASEAPAARRKIVAITACPTGIAHTYMAADGLTYAAEDMGVDFKVEPQGSSGGEKLTQAEIDAADAVIFAVDVPVRGRERFAGKPYVEVPVKRGIDEPTKLIETALSEADNPNGRCVTATGAADASENGEEASSWGKRIYKALMSGVSYMIPFVAAGGIILAIGFMLEAITMPNLGDVDPAAILDINGESGRTLFNLQGVPLSLYLGAALHTIGGAGLGLMVPALAAYIAYGLAQRPGIAPGFIAGSIAVTVGGGFIGGIVAGLLAGLTAYTLQQLKLPRWLGAMMPVVIIPLVASLVAGGLMLLILGGPIAWITTSLNEWLTSMSGSSAILLGIILGLMMGFDLGGPVNKAAYLFATAGLAANTDASREIMAAVIIAGMTPPLGMALATTLRGKLFSAPERENGKAAWLLGASFISEGAIPFATADPARVIPSSMAGSAVAGAIAMGAGVASPAPHGGLWIIGLATNIPMFLLAVVAGTLVTGLVYVALKSVGTKNKVDA